MRHRNLSAMEGMSTWGSQHCRTHPHSTTLEWSTRGGVGRLPFPSWGAGSLAALRRTAPCTRACCGGAGAKASSSNPAIDRNLSSPHSRVHPASTLHPAVTLFCLPAQTSVALKMKCAHATNCALVHLKEAGEHRAGMKRKAAVALARFLHRSGAQGRMVSTPGSVVGWQVPAAHEFLVAGVAPEPHEHGLAGAEA